MRSYSLYQPEELHWFWLIFLTMMYTTELFYHDMTFETVGESALAGIDIASNTPIPVPSEIAAMWAKFHTSKVPTKYGQFSCQNSIHCEGCKTIKRREARLRARQRSR